MLTFRNTKQIKYYKSLDKLKILTFWQIIKDKNILLLDFDYVDGKKYSKEQLKELEDTWLRLYDEYYVLLDDSKSKFKMNKSFDELKVRDKINQIKYNYDFLINLKGYYGLIPDSDITKYEQETYKRLTVIDKRIKPLYFDGIDTNLSNLDKVMKSMINRYNIDHKESQKEIQKEIDNVYDVVASAESWLERSIPISDMVVSHWIAIQNQIKQKQKAQQKNGK
jgi:hypothetical protein